MPEAFQAAGVRRELVVYYNSEHAFFNDTGLRYNPRAEADSWERMLDWLRMHLPSPSAGK